MCNENSDYKERVTNFDSIIDEIDYHKNRVLNNENSDTVAAAPAFDSPEEELEYWKNKSEVHESNKGQ